MAKMNIFILCIILKVISCAEVRGNLDQSGSRKRPVSDPVSNFFSSIGDLFLDIDGTFATQTGPKVQREDQLASQILRSLQPRREYFDRIQENYKTLQDKLSSAIADSISASGAIRRANQLKPDRNLADKTPVVHRGHSSTHGIQDPENTGRQIGISDEEVKKSIERILSNARKTNEFLGSMGSQVLDDASSLLIRRSGDHSETSDISDPLRTDDSAYSESRFDKYIKELMNNQRRWFIDNPLFNRWQRTEKHPRINTEMEVPLEPSEEIISTSTVVTPDSQSTETYESSTKFMNKLPLSEEKLPKTLSNMPVMSGNYYRVDDSGDVEEVDIVLEPESSKIVGLKETRDGDEGTIIEIEEETEEKFEERDTVILAFTPDGVPLKLRMGPEIINPVKYLHRVLRSADVTLKVPVESYEDLEPVGKEVLLLGAGSGVITRTVYLDISNPHELKSLLRTLRKSKVSEKY